MPKKVELPDVLVEELDELSQEETETTVKKVLSSFVESERKEPISKGSTPSTSFKSMNIEEYVGKLRQELASLRAENKRLTEQVALFEKERRENEKALQLHKTRADMSSSMLENSIEDVYKMMESVGKSNSERLGRELALRQLGFETGLKDQVIEKLQYKLSDRFSKDDVEDISETVLEIANWVNQLQSKEQPPTPTAAEE